MIIVRAWTPPSRPSPTRGPALAAQAMPDRRSV
jgi:hypothetical protein